MEDDSSSYSEKLKIEDLLPVGDPIPFREPENSMKRHRSQMYFSDRCSWHLTSVLSFENRFLINEPNSSYNFLISPESALYDVQQEFKRNIIRNCAIKVVLGDAQVNRKKGSWKFLKHISLK